MKKKVLSILLAICMVVGLLPAVTLGASAAESAGEMTIYFQNNWLWDDVCIYYWGSADTNPTWPGNAMEYAGNDGTYDIYKFTVPTDVTGIIINGVKNDGSGTRDQTPDITSGWYDGICYYMQWNDGNAVGSENIETILPTAYVAEVDGQGFETLAEAIAYAKGVEGSTVKLLADVSLDTYITIDSGKFTIDLNGFVWESSTFALYVRGTADVVLTSSVDGGVLRGTGTSTSTVSLLETAKLEISGGTVEHTAKSYAVNMSDSGNPTDAQLIISGGKVATNGSYAVSAFGSSVTVTGGTLQSEYEHIFYHTGIVDLTGHANPAGIKISIGYSATEVTVGTDILLPDGYCFVDENGDPVTTLTTYNDYTVAEAAPAPTYVAEVDGQGFETLAEAIAYAKGVEGSTVKLLADVSLDTYITIDSGKFTIDLNGFVWESSAFALYVRGTADVVLTSSVDGGVLRGAGDGYSTILLYGDAKLEISGGTVEHTAKSSAVNMSDSGNPTEAQLIISGGKVATNGSPAVGAFGSSVIVTGGTLESNSYHITYFTGVIDLSGYDAVAGITISIGYNVTEATVGTDILLPAGYCFVDENGNPVTTLTTYNDYTVAVDETPAATVTGVSLSGNGVTFDAETNTYYISSDATDIVLTVTGTNFANLTEDYFVCFATNASILIHESYMDVDVENNIATRADLLVGGFKLSDGFEICYTTDNQATWIGLGVYVTYVENTTPEYATKDELEAAIAELQQLIDQLEQTYGIEVPALQQALADLQQQVAALDDTFATDEDVKALSDELNALAQRVTDLENTYATKTELETAIAALQQQIDDLELVYGADNAGLAAELAALQQQLTDLQNALDALDDTYVNETQLIDAVNTINQSITDLASRVAALEATYATKAELEEAIKNLNEAIAAGDAANAQALTEAVAKLEKALADAVAALEQADADNKAALEKMISEAEAALEEAIAKLRADLEDAVAELENADKENAEALAQAITDLTAAIEAAEAVAAAEDTKIRAELAAAQATLQSAINSLSAQLSATRSQLLAAISAGDKALDQKIADLAAALEAAVAASQAADEALKAELNARIDESVATLEEAIAAVAADLSKAQQELQEAMDAGDKMLGIRLESLGKAMNVALEAAKAAANASDEALKAELNARIDEAVAALEKAIAQVQKNLDDAKAQLEAKDQELMAKDAQLNTLVIVAIVLGSVGICGCIALTVFIIVDKRKKAN